MIFSLAIFIHKFTSLLIFYSFYQLLLSYSSIPSVRPLLRSLFWKIQNTSTYTIHSTCQLLLPHNTKNMTSSPIRNGLLALARCRGITAVATPSISTTLSSTTATTNTIINKRWYRGDSGDAEHNLSPKEQELLSVAQPRADAIYERHVRLPNLDDIPQQNLAGNDMGRDEALANKDEVELDVRRKRLVYRAKQRGWLEVDLLLGTWANQNVPALNMDELDQFEAFVNLETIDIYNVITLRSDVPEEMKRGDGSGVVERIQDWARASPLGKAEPEKYASVKNENNLI